MQFAQIKNINGYEYIFKPSGIVGLRVEPGASGKNTTHVIGILNAPLEVADAPQKVLDNLGITKEFAKLTGAYGEVWIRTESISVFNTAYGTDRSDLSRSQTMIYASGSPFKVYEDVETIKTMLGIGVSPPVAAAVSMAVSRSTKKRPKRS